MRSIGSTNWVFGLYFLIYGLQPLIFYRALKVTTLTSMNLIWDLSSDIMVFICSKRHLIQRKELGCSY